MKKTVLAVLVCIVPLLSLHAENPKAVLTYYDSASQVEVYDFTGQRIRNIYMGYPLLIGYAVKTNNSTAELEMSPNGSIIKLQENAYLKIEELQGAKEAKSNRFALMKGFIRVVASRLYNVNYSVKTPSTVLGVRGTDFAVEVKDSGESEIMVQRGSVEVYEPATQNSLILSAGEAANVRNRVLQKMDVEMEEVRRRIESFTFKSKAPESVPRRVPDDYSVDYDYFSDIDYREFRDFFEGENYFIDSEEYLEKYRDYYKSEMSDFQARFEKEQETFETFRYREMERYYRYRGW